jgi:GTPase
MKLLFNNKLENKSQEKHEGNIEYKFKLVKLSKTKIDKLTTQMLYRFIQGNGIAEYYLGVMDNGESVGLNINELYITLNCILDCLYELNGLYNTITIFTQTDDRCCVHLTIEKKNLPNSKIKL